MCRRLWDRWLMMGAIGVTVGLTGYLLFLTIGFLEVRIIISLHLWHPTFAIAAMLSTPSS